MAVIENEINLPTRDQFEDMALSLRLMSGRDIANAVSWKDVFHLVRTGHGPQNFEIGDTFTDIWRDVAAGKDYVTEMIVTDHRDSVLKDGEVVPSLGLVWRFTTPFGVQFSNYQAFFHTETGLSPGTYHVTMGDSWGDNVKAGKSYQFTLTQPVPAGGQLSGFRNAPNEAPANWRVYSHASNTDPGTIETVTVSEGTGGTSLGTLQAAGNEQLNSLHCVGYGYNRYAVSAVRQWLNSDLGVGAWWKPQSKYDRPPAELTTKAGFLTGFSAEFKDLLKETKITTALNTVTDAAIGTEESTYDKFFLPSLEQMYINPQAPGAEGESWPYFKRLLGRTTPAAQWQTYPELISHGIENHGAAQYCRLRSAYRSNGYNTWCIYSSGNVNLNAGNSLRMRPACRIC